MSVALVTLGETDQPADCIDMPLCFLEGNVTPSEKMKTRSQHRRALPESLPDDNV